MTDTSRVETHAPSVSVGSTRVNKSCPTFHRSGVGLRCAYSQVLVLTKRLTFEFTVTPSTRSPHSDFCPTSRHRMSPRLLSLSRTRLRPVPASRDPVVCGPCPEVWTRYTPLPSTGPETQPTDGCPKRLLSVCIVTSTTQTPRRSKL